MKKRMKGLYTNCRPNDQPEEFYRDALNINIDQSIGAITNERGTEFIVDLPDGSSCTCINAGSVLLPDGKIILFLEGDTGDYIILFNPETSDLEYIVNNEDLNFNSDFPIQADFYVDKFEDTHIVWVDGLNPARFLNITDPPSSFSEEILSLFPSISDITDFTVERINNTGGSLKAGSYYFAIAYKHADGTLTNFYQVIGPVNISSSFPTNERSFRGSQPEEDTSKSITLSMENVDQSYESIKIAVIPKINGVFDAVQLLPEIPITTERFTYSGNESFTPGALAEIQIDQVFYDKPEAIKINEDQIYLGNLDEKPDIDYQKYANNIIVKPAIKTLSSALEYRNVGTNGWITQVEETGYHDKTNSYRDPNNILYNKGYKRGEVYAVYISWLLKSGGESRAYHIPGRQPAGGADPATTFGHIQFNNSAPATGNIDINVLIQTGVGTFGTLTIGDPWIKNGDTADELAAGVSAFLNQTGISDINNFYNIQIIPGFFNRVQFTAKAQNSTYNGTISVSQLQDPVLELTIKDLQGGSSGSGDSPELAEFVDQDLDHIENKKRFQFVEDVESGGMAYWENENETYPDNDRWNSTSVGGEDLRGKKVRHHHFPSTRQRPIYNWVSVSDTYDYEALGFKLENVEIPPELEDRVLGYKIYYAKRTDENKRIIDISTNIESRIKDGLIRTNFGNGTGFLSSQGERGENIYSLHPFHSMIDRKSVSAVDYLKVTDRLNNFIKMMNIDLTGDISSGSSTINPTQVVIFDHINRVSNFITSDTFKKVKGIAYVDSIDQSSFTPLSQFGISNNADNNRGETKVIVEIDGDDYHHMDSVISKQPNERYTGICQYVLEMRTHKTDVFLSFEKQILNYTNYYHTDLNDTDSDVILGGDTFIGVHTYKAVFQPDSNNQPIIGIHNFLTESYSNPTMRYAGQNIWEEFYPNIDYKIFAAIFFRDGEVRYGSGSGDDIKNYDNFYGYNPDYSDTNDIKFPTISSKLSKRVEKYPTRIIRNSKGRQFFPDDFIDLSTKRGDLITLSVYNNILIPHMQRALVRTRGKEDIQVGDIRAFLGSGDIFSVKPDEIIYTEDGFGGVQKRRHSISTPFGYFFYDDQAKRMYSLTHDGIKDISETILPELRLFDETLRFGYNPYNERIHCTTNNESYSYSPKIDAWISRHSYKPTLFLNDLRFMYSIKDNKLWKHDSGLAGVFYDDIHSTIYKYIVNNGNSNKVSSLIIDSDVVIESNFVLEIINNEQSFTTFEITDGTNVANNSALNDNTDASLRLIAAVLATEINNNLNAKAYAQDNKVYISSNSPITISSGFDSVTNFNESSLKVTNKWSTFDQFRIENTTQDTDYKDIIYFRDPVEDSLENIYIGNARHSLKYWIINKFRDISNVPETVDEELAWAYNKRMEDKYHIVTLIKNNNYGEEIFLYGSDLSEKISIR
jgi:hypothetical protein